MHKKKQPFSFIVLHILLCFSLHQKVKQNTEGRTTFYFGSRYLGIPKSCARAQIISSFTENKFFENLVVLVCSHPRVCPTMGWLHAKVSLKVFFDEVFSGTMRGWQA